MSVRLASLFNSKARLWIKGRSGWKENLKKNIDPGKKYLWIHCASLGEFEQGRPVIEAVKEKFPEMKVVLSFFSPSGYEVRKNYPLADYICYLPSDSPSNARYFIETVKPVFAVFIKYEFWYYFINELYKRNIPVYLVSGIFRNDQVFFRTYGKWYRNILKMFTHLFVQDEKSKDLLSGAGINNVTVSGDTRFDRVLNIFNNRKEIEPAKEFSEGSYTIVCGSTWQPDDEILLKWLHHSPENVKFIIAPHEIHESRINWLVSNIKIPSVRFSQYSKGNFRDKRVLIIDNIGMLSSLYGYGKIAYIGGGFGKGIHNVAEAAVYGIPVVFGPNYHKFAEAVGLINHGGAFTVSDYNSLETILNKMYGNINDLEKSSAKASEYIKTRTGATNVFIDFISAKKSSHNNV